MIDIARFWSLVDRTGECWIWLGRVGTNGYGYFGSELAHRLAYELEIGPLLPGEFACHRCDNRICVRPGHLFAGSPADNVADMVRKGRHFSRTKPERYARGARHGRYTMPERTARGDANGARKHPEAIARGERVAGVRLNQSLVREIRTSTESSAAVAKRLGITPQSVWNVRARRTWRHVT
jgi:hypothetical protein